MKICKKCKVPKDLNDFYEHSQMADGHLNVCKICTRKRVSDYWHKNAKTLRVKEHDRWQRRKLKPAEVKRRLEYQRKYRTKNKNIMKAHNQVHRKLIAPDSCEICGKLCKPHGHHEDYDKPLEVIWVCPVCHRNIKD